MISYINYNLKCLQFIKAELCISVSVNFTIIGSDNREVLLRVKHERVRVTSDSGAQICYTSRSRTLWILLHTATCALTNRRINTSKWYDNSPLNTFINKSERILLNDILAHGKGDYRLQVGVNFSSVFAFISPWDVHVTALRELTGYASKSRCVTCSLPWTILQCTHILMTSHPMVLFYKYMFTFYV